MEEVQSYESNGSAYWSVWITPDIKMLSIALHNVNSLESISYLDLVSPNSRSQDKVDWMAHGPDVRYLPIVQGPRYPM